MPDNSIPISEITLFNQKLEIPETGGFVLNQAIAEIGDGWIKFQDIAGELNRMNSRLPGEKDKAALEINWPNWPTADAATIVRDSDVHLRKIYLKAEPEKKLEFALWLVIRCKDEQMQVKLARQYPIPNKFSELSLKIWRTRNQKVLTEMAIV